MSSPSQAHFRGWFSALDKLLTDGRLEKDLARLSLLLESAPYNWHRSVSACRWWGRLPCWSRVLTNKQAGPDWIEKALGVCSRHGADVTGDYRKSKSRHSTSEPVYMGMTWHLDRIHAQAYLSYLLGHPDFSAQNPQRSSNAVAWLSKMFACDALWADAPVSARVLTWGVLDAIPDLKRPPLGERVWVAGLGLPDSSPFAPLALQLLAMRGLDGNLVIDRTAIPSVVLSRWPKETAGEWRPAPAWAWAVRKGLFSGGRMILDEVMSHQPRPWDPNECLPGSGETVGQWLLNSPSMLPSSDGSPAHPPVASLDVLGFDWFSGDAGHRPIDKLRISGLGLKELGPGRWRQLDTQDRATQLESSLPDSTPPPGFRSRL